MVPTLLGYVSLDGFFLETTDRLKQIQIFEAPFGSLGHVKTEKYPPYSAQTEDTWGV